MPRIAACLDASPDTRWISFAGEHDGATLVRMSGRAGAFDCTIGADGPRIAPRDEAMHVAGDGAAIFVRAPGENPGGECYEAPEVRTANNELLGWMADPEGC
jgi:hypothetical protein